MRVLPIWVTEDQIKKAKELDLLTYMQLYEPDNLKRSGANEYRLKDHGSVVISNGLWSWKANSGIGGRSALDFLIHVRKMSFPDAVSFLASAPVQQYRRSAITQQKKRSFMLPEKSAQSEKLKGYLCDKRAIDETLIDLCLESGLLYESVHHAKTEYGKKREYHNCTFVGRDQTGFPRYAMVRGISAVFKGEAAASKKQYGFCLSPEDSSSNTLILFESPIEVLSHASLYSYGVFDLGDTWRLSLGGTEKPALVEFLKHHQNITRVYLALNKDEAGIKGMDNLLVYLRDHHPQITAQIVLPESKSDWNLELCHIANSCQKEKGVRRLSMDKFVANTAPNLPEKCYSIIPKTEELIVIHRGELGYYAPSEYIRGKAARQIADNENMKLGVQPFQEKAMLVGASEGWDHPDADPEKQLDIYRKQNGTRNR